MRPPVEEFCVQEIVIEQQSLCGRCLLPSEALTGCVAQFLAAAPTRHTAERASDSPCESYDASSRSPSPADSDQIAKTHLSPDAPCVRRLCELTPVGRERESSERGLDVVTLNVTSAAMNVTSGVTIMALSTAERMAAMRIRKAIEAARLEKQTLSSAYSTPFFEWMNDHGSLINFAMPLDNAGIECPAFDDDSGGKSFTGHFEQVAADEEAMDRIPANSLQRAELIVESLLDAAMELASDINSYKRHHLAAGLAEIEAAGDADERMEQASLLRRMLESLSKDVRRTLPNWKASAI